MIDDQLKQRRQDVLDEHFQSEVDHAFDRTFATFAGPPRYEIVPTAQVHEGEEAVLAYHRAQREAFPDQRHDGVTFHFADDDTVVAEFELIGTNTGPYLGSPPTGKAFRVATIAVFSFEGDRITNERVYLDGATLLRQIGREDLLPWAGVPAVS